MLFSNSKHLSLIRFDVTFNYSNVFEHLGAISAEDPRLIEADPVLQINLAYENLKRE